MQNRALNLLENRTILYAEDEDGIRENVIFILEMFFKKVYSAKDGKEAFLLYEELKPDVLMVDICMPHADGLEVVQKVRKQNSKIPIIVLSAHRDEEYLWRAVEQKISKYLTKPFDKDEILEALKVCAMELADGVFEEELGENLKYDLCQKSFIKSGEIVALSDKESRLFEYFLINRGKVLSFETISEHLWGYESPSKEAIKALVKSVRKKADENIISNHYGVGYSLA
ncbi:MAG: response regulator transcription factor [Sulfurospirillaceae bacterium]|nr:response regulator transcription factor [Sulfurospirillaceae bacterium]